LMLTVGVLLFLSVGHGESTPSPTRFAGAIGFTHLSASSGSRLSTGVMAALVAAIHAGVSSDTSSAWRIREKSPKILAPHRVDGRDKRGHDPLRERARFQPSAFTIRCVNAIGFAGEGADPRA
jgi:hypothetical protein